MRYSAPIVTIALVCAMLAPGTRALAQSAATWVSGTGADAGACPITAPCKTFQYAHDQTAAGGVINVLASGSFGPINISKPIGIVADSVEALIQSAVACQQGGVAAVCIDSTVDSLPVHLRGLTVDLNNLTGADGIRLSNGTRTVSVLNSVVRGANGFGLLSEQGSTAALHVTGSTFSNNQRDGIYVGSFGTQRVVVDRTHLDNNAGSGIVITPKTGLVKATIRESVAAGNGSSGIRVGGSGGRVNAIIGGTTAVKNKSWGLLAIGTGARAAVGYSTFTGNTVGFQAEYGGRIVSFKTNRVDLNMSNGVPTTTAVMK